MDLDFFVATEGEIAELNSLDDLVDLMFGYEITASGANGFQDFRLVSKFFLGTEKYVPNEIIKTVDYIYEDENHAFSVYRLDTEFVEKVALINRTDLDKPDSVEFWQSRGYFEQGIWNCVFGVYNLSKIAVRDNKNLYLVEVTG